MTPQQRQTELQKYRAIIMATYDFLIATHGASIVFDNVSSIAAYYEKLKLKAEEYCNKNQLSKIKLRLAKLIERHIRRADLSYAIYIKEKTGYEIDLFEDLRKRVNAILAQNEIRSKQERDDVYAMLQYYQTTSTEGEEVDRLKALISDFIERSPKTKDVTIISAVEKDGIIEETIEIFSDPKPKLYDVQKIVAPDGKRNLRVVQWSDGKHHSTYVAIDFPAASGPLCGINGIHYDIKASWKDNSTIVIETSNEYELYVQHKQVRSFDDVIVVEYENHPTSFNNQSENSLIE